MISTETLIVMLVFLVYVGVWYIYMNNFMDAVDKSLGRLEATAYADEIQHKANTLCANGGSMAVTFRNAVNITSSGNAIYINGIKREVNCTVNTVAKENINKITLRKEQNTLIIQ